MARGRKRKNVKREPNGRPSRAGILRLVIDNGTDQAKAKQKMYGTEGYDAIGRAKAHDLLGANADAIKDTARKIAKAYWPMLEVGSYRCTLADSSAGYWREQSEHDKRREEWLTETLRRVGRLGRAHRRAFDDLVIDVHPDSGPVWLDSLIWHKVREQDLPPEHMAVLAKALEAIDTVMT